LELYYSRAKVAHLRAALGVAQVEAEVINGYLEGYEEALIHVRTLILGLDLQPCKPFKRIEDC